MNEKRTLTIQLAPLGDWPAHDGEHDGVVQRVTPEAVARLVENFDGEKKILVDFDHASESGGSTEAAGWITGLADGGAEGLLATVELTDRGREAVEGGGYRFVSVAWDVAGGEPVRVSSVALTNRPNLPVRPILNSTRATFVSPIHRSAENGAGDPCITDTRVGKRIFTNKERSPNMDKLKEVLGLKPEATEEEVAGAVESLVKRIAELEGAAKERAAETFAAQNADKGIGQEVLKNAWLASPETTELLVKNMKPATKPATDTAQVVLNAATAKKPALPTPEVGVRERMAALPPGERSAFFREHAGEF